MKKSEIKLASTTLDLAVESKRADKVLKAVNTLNSKAMAAEVEIEELVSHFFLILLSLYPTPPLIPLPLSQSFSVATFSGRSINCTQKPWLQSLRLRNWLLTVFSFWLPHLYLYLSCEILKVANKIWIPWENSQKLATKNGWLKEGFGKELFKVWLKIFFIPSPFSFFLLTTSIIFPSPKS